jgi:hypothetical protein
MIHGEIIVQAKHKIQSAGGPLDMKLSQVPKMLPVLRNHWAPLAFCVSFKVSLSVEWVKVKPPRRGFGREKPLSNLCFK